jgi:hypothetical protein
MEYREVEQALLEGDFERFIKALSQIPASEVPEVKLRPKIGTISETKEDPSIYLGLLGRGVPPKQALQACKEFESLDAALLFLSRNK